MANARVNKQAPTATSRTYNRNASIVKEYDGFSAQYDDRWEKYLRDTHIVTLELLRPISGDNILDASAGTGLLAHAILARTHGKVTLSLIDISSGMLTVARKRLLTYPQVTILRRDVHRTKFKDRKFTHIVSASAFHYYADGTAVIQEFHRILKKGGLLVITDWSRDTIRFKLFNAVLKVVDPAHGRMYSTPELVTLLESNGFLVEQKKQFSSGLWSLLSIRARKI